MNRRAWAIAILFAWFAALGWLVKREYFRTTGERLAEAALSVPPGSEFYRLDLAGQQVGFASTSIDTLGPKVRVTDVLLVDLPVLGALHRTRARSRALVNRALRLETLDVEFEGDGGRFTAHGEVRGDSLLVLTLASPGGTQTNQVHLDHPIVLPSLVPLRLAFGGNLKPGRTVRVTVFDPIEMVQRDVNVTIAAETTLVVPDSAVFDSTVMAWTPAHFDTVRAFKIEQRASGLSTAAWIDAQGRVVRATGPVGLTLERSAYEIAYQNFHHRDTARVAAGSRAPGSEDIIGVTAIAAGAPLKASHRSPDEFRVRLTGVDLRGLELGGGGQTLAGDTLTVRRAEPADLTARYELPSRDTGLARWLAPEPLIESADPRIRAQAHAIVGEERDPARATAALLRWVGAYVHKEQTVGLPSAVRVFELKRGDCNEITALFVALARAAGLPARPAAGLVRLGDHFYYHAWPEVYLGVWVPVDPTFDQLPADPTHLRFVTGGLARQVALLRFIGRLKLEVL
ncbi:MAG TPA: transglutaminase-like domain-containing protein [Gemmatimonadales bacterium]|nr:transglutaminase-like domain-containing protein [Gemmatimonadales bacterium]